MKMKLLGIAGIALLLSGCNSPNQCIEKKYTGVVIDLESSAPNVHCSNGELTPNGESWITADGDYYKKFGVYAEFRPTEPTEMKEK